jgi:hypothetical protein
MAAGTTVQCIQPKEWEIELTVGMNFGKTKPFLYPRNVASPRIGSSKNETKQITHQKEIHWSS